jgi:hypothetical protein
MTTEDLVDVIGAAMGIAASSGVGGRLNIVVAGNVIGGLWSTLTRLGVGQTGAVSASFPTPNVVLSPLLPAGTIIVGMSEAAVAFTSPGAPVRLQALDIPRGGVDLAVWGYWADSVLHPEAVCTVTGYVPTLSPTPKGGPAADDAGRSSRSSKQNG